MEMKIGSVKEYRESLKKLLPIGKYWSELLEDSDSDLNAILDVRACELVKFKERMRQLLREAYPASADETIADWERVTLDTTNEGLPIERRRALVIGNSGFSSIYTIANSYGVKIKAEFPFKTGNFGHIRCGHDRLGAQNTLSVVFVYVTGAEGLSSLSMFEDAIAGKLLANQIVYFMYTYIIGRKFESLEELSKAVKMELKMTSFIPAIFGRCRAGQDRLSAPFMADVALIHLPVSDAIWRRCDIEDAIMETLPAYMKIYIFYGNEVFYLGWKQSADGKSFATLREISNATGVMLKESMPFIPASFGYTRFGVTRVSHIDGADVVMIRVDGYGSAFRRCDIERAVFNLLRGSNKRIYFIYDMEVFYGGYVS